MRQIVAIGGGELRLGETVTLDRYIAGLAGVSRPKVLFIPTASNDSSDYCEAVEAIYGQIGCEVRSLRLIEHASDREGFKEKIAWADVVYVGGGNTRTMLQLWRELGADSALRHAWEAGTLMSGLSAGANCWMRYANSDAPQIEGRKDVLTIRLEFLDFLPLTVCPHMKREAYRLGEFSNMMRTTPGVGIGLDDCCALHVRDDEYRLIACEEGACAHRIGWEGDSVRHERLVPDETFRPLDELTQFSATEC